MWQKIFNGTIKQNEHISRNLCLNKKHCVYVSKRTTEHRIQPTKRKSPNVKVQEIRRFQFMRSSVEVWLLSIQQEFLCSIKTNRSLLQGLIG